MTLTMSAAIDGRLTIHPWLRSELREPAGEGKQHSVLGEDVFSLIVARSKARGLASFSGDGPPSVRWGHNDAGGDWTQDDLIRRLAWFQCAVPDRPTTGRRLPIQPVLSMLDELLALVGVVDLTAVQTIVPLAGVPDGRFDLAAMARWFDFANPETAGSGTAVVSMAGADPTSLQRLPELIQARSGGRIGVQEAAVPTIESPYGMSWLLGPGERVQLAWRCSLPTWSTEAAGWLVEVLVEAFHELAITTPVAISVVAEHD